MAQLHINAGNKKTSYSGASAYQFNINLDLQNELVNIDDVEEFISNLSTQLQSALFYHFNLLKLENQENPNPTPIPTPEPSPEPTPKPQPLPPFPDPLEPSFRLEKPASGINLTSLDYWYNVNPSENLMHKSEWPVSTFKLDGYPWRSWGNAKKRLDPNGYPVGVETSQRHSAFLFNGAGDKYSIGPYTIEFDGEGEVEITGDAQIKVSTGEKKQFYPSRTNKGLELHINKSSENNHVRNIRILNTDRDGVFNLEWIANYSFVNVMRFMDWGRTNWSQVKTWEDRCPKNYRTWAHPAGVPYESMISLCNAFLIEPWLHIPHGADDKFIESLAELCLTLEPEIRVFVAYTNEAWNSQFQDRSWEVGRASGQWSYVREMSKNYTHTDNEHIRWCKFYAERSAFVFKTFKDILGPERVVGIAEGQSGNPWLNERILENYNNLEHPDAFAIAPYWGLNIHRDDLQLPDAQLLEKLDKNLTVDEENWPSIQTQIIQNKRLAEKYGLYLFGYEGGPHLTPHGDSSQVDKIVRINRSPEMAEQYKTFANLWSANGGGLFCWFADQSQPTQHGDWGILNHVRDSSFRHQAVKEISANWNIVE